VKWDILYGVGLMSDFAMLSHILPPSPSGQAMVLAQLLDSFAPENYCLLSVKQYADDDHPATYYHLGAAPPSSSSKIALPVQSRMARLKATTLPRLPSLLVRIYKWLHRTKQRFASATPNHMAVVEMRTQQIVSILQSESCNLLIACTGDLYDLPAGYRAAQQMGIAFIPYIFDDYVYQWTGEARAFALRQEPEIITGAQAVIAPNEFMAAAYEARYGVESTIIHNPARLPDLAALDRAEPFFDSGTTNIVYTGAVYHAQFDAFRNLIAAMQRLNHDDVRLHIFTSQPPTWLAAEGIEGPIVVFHAHIPHCEIAKIQRQADVLLLPLAFESPIPEVIKTSAPGKLGEYLAVGRPILVHAPADSFVSWYFREHECGAVADVNDPAILGQTLEKLLADQVMQTQLGQRAREQAAKDFDVEAVRLQFTKLVKANLL
jgi:glycosyltransferase involved in cell wall biosynthesis